MPASSEALTNIHRSIKAVPSTIIYRR
jgi:hypothetical protein